MKHFRSTRLAIGSALTIVGTIAVVARPRYGGTLRIETDTAIRTLDPGGPAVDEADAVARGRLLPLVFETLVAPDPAGGLRPLLATSWESDARATRWRFHFRRGTKLHDGSTLDRMQVAAALGAKSNTWKVSGSDDGVVIESDRPLPGLPWELADLRYAVALRRPNGELVGTGPFRVERLEGGRLSLRAHEDHWEGRPFVDAVQIETGRSSDDLIASLELGRADMVNVRATDARRLTQRGFRVVGSQPLHLYALIFDRPRASPPDEPLRTAMALAVDRSAMCGVLLQRRCEPAFTLLPDWLSGYASILATHQSGSAKALVSSLPPRQRLLSLRIEATDVVARNLADRIIVDAREAGLTITLAPAGLAPRPDLRLARVRLAATAPERALDSVLNELKPRVGGVLAIEAMPEAGAPLEATYRFERALVDSHVVVPVVFLPELYGLGQRVESWRSQPVLPSGSWDLTGVWVP